LQSGTASDAELKSAATEIRELNEKLTRVEDEFSFVLGEGSRWLEHVILSLLSLVVLAVASVGLTLTYFTSRSITRGLADIAVAAEAIGRGDFKKKVPVRSRDEIGQVSSAVNRMGDLLESSYHEIEMRVQARTAELDQAIRARDDFMSVSSHELKTPLTTLKLQAQMRRRLLEKGDTNWLAPEKVDRMIRDDERQVNRLTRLVDDMLDVSRMRTGKLSLWLERVDLCEIVNGIIERFTLELEKAGCKIEFERCETVFGEWDSYRLEQAITNLVTNAMKYGAGHPIHVTVCEEGGLAKFSIRDHGIGISKEDQQRIFHQFERAVSAKNISGLGLGLYITKQIVEAQGGTITVKSEPGVGSEFTITLKLKRA
jgi:signal transduction histidine kinase